MDFFPQIQTPIPGPRSRELSLNLKTYEAPTVTFFSDQSPIFWKKAEGVHVWDVDDNRYIDLTSAFGVASLGHSDPDVMAAIRNQTNDLSHAMGDVHPSELKAHVCQKLSEVTFERWSPGKYKGQTLLCNSGFEAVEAAIKTARMFTGKRGVIAFEGGYHGLGYGALEATWRKDFRKPFSDQLGNFVTFASYPRETGDSGKNRIQVETIERQIQTICAESEIGAILVEPFQGRGGEVIPPKEFLPMLRRVCSKKRILLIVDEIYVGLWRTGKWFAVEHTETIPDIICLGKALTGSLPMSACVGRADIMAAWPASAGEALHTSTFLGNPLACAAALASLSKFENTVPSWDIAKKGSALVGLLKEKLESFSPVEVRGIGFLVGIEFPKSSKIAIKLCDALLQVGLIALPSGSQGEVLALTPPLLIKEDVLEWCTEKLVKCLESIGNPVARV
jgi:4-aminobutyrate aminotransferase-like enzyme